MRKSLRLILALVLALSLLSGHALAATAEYKTTQQFIDYLEQKNVKYTLKGVVSDNNERVDVSFSLDNFDSATCAIFFRSSNHAVSFRIWDIVKASAGKNYILATLNQLNSSYKYAKFVLDEEDSTIQAELDMYIDEDHSAECVYDTMIILLDVIDDADAAKLIHSLE